MKTMKRFLFAAVLLVAAAASANAQLLYRITGNGLEKPSYIVGTYHLAPASFVDSIPGARKAIAAVEQVCGEVVMSEMNSPENMLKIKAAMMLPEGKVIDEIFTPEQMQRINEYVKSVLGADFSNPMIKGSMGKMTPTAISTQLQLVITMKNTPGFNPMALIDSYFQDEAVRQGKAVAGFESVDFQISVLYTGTPLERQKEQLLCAADNSEYTAMIVKELFKAYFSQDLAAIKAVFDEKLGNTCDSTPEEDDMLIYNRNVDWVKKMPAMMAVKPTLFVVGAGHLPGERGVLELLARNGYVVEAVVE